MRNLASQKVVQKMETEPGPILQLQYMIQKARAQLNATQSELEIQYLTGRIEALKDAIRLIRDQ